MAYSSRRSGWSRVLPLTLILIACVATAAAQEPSHINITATARDVPYQCGPGGAITSQAFNIQGEGSLRLAPEADPKLTPPIPQGGAAAAAMFPPCPRRPLTIPPPGGTLSTFEEGHIAPAGSYYVWVSPSADQRTATRPWRRFGPYDLRGGRKYLFFIRDGAVDGPIETDSRLNVYSTPSSDTTATYYENRSESRGWKAVTICPAAAQPPPPPPPPPPLPPFQTPCARRPLTIPPPGGTLSTFEEGHIAPAGSYYVWVAPSADQRTATGPWRRFGPYDLRGGRKYLFFIRDGGVDGPIETDSRLNVYSTPSSDTTATYYENRSESRGWKAVTICPPAALLRPGAGPVAQWSADGNAGDSVGGNAGTLKGGVSYTAGVSGQAFNINGRRGSGVVLGNPVNMRLQTFSIVAWLKRADARKSTWDNELNPTACILCYGPGGYAFGMWDDGRLFLSKNAYSVVNTSQLKITDTEFHLVALTVAEGRVVFYVDGEAEVTPPYNPGYTFSSDVAIGASITGNDLRVSWFGLLDEVQFHNRALTAEEIRAIVRK